MSTDHSLTTDFPNRGRGALIREAEQHADMLSRDDRMFDRRTPETLVVNMLRHEYTDYDDEQF